MAGREKIWCRYLFCPRLAARHYRHQILDRGKLNVVKKFGFTIALAVLLTAAATTVPSFAQPARTDNQQLLQLRYDSVSARAGFTTGVMADIVSLVPQASDLNAHIDALNADLTTLEGYVSAGDEAGFASFVSGTINPEMKNSDDAIKADRANFREWNVTAQTRQTLKDMYDQRKATFDLQIQSLTVQLGNLRLAGYSNAVANYDARIEKLSAKGVDVSGMQAVEAGAQANVIQPLQAAVASGNAVQVRIELKEKSLGNGAPYSYHFWAKMDTEGGKAVSARIADNATQAGYGEELAEVNAKLAAVQSTLDQAGTSPYTAEQRDTIWGDLHSAAEQLISIIKALGGH
jgi:hypothetical protein